MYNSAFAHIHVFLLALGLMLLCGDKNRSRNQHKMTFAWHPKHQDQQDKHCVKPLTTHQGLENHLVPGQFGH